MLWCVQMKMTLIPSVNGVHVIISAFCELLWTSCITAIKIHSKQWGFTQHSQEYIHYIHIWKWPSKSLPSLPCQRHNANMWTQTFTLISSICSVTVLYVMTLGMLRTPRTHAHTVRECHKPTKPLVLISCWTCPFPAHARGECLTRTVQQVN